MGNISRKTVVLLALTLLLLAGLFFIFTNAGSRIERYYENKKAQAIVDKMEKPYREDIYGGSTPEETYALFIKALKEENIELAAKYFIVKRQEEWLQELKAQKEQNALNEFIMNLPNLNELKKVSSEIEYTEYAKTYNSKIVPERQIDINGNKVVIPQHSFTARVIFLKNTYTNKWKIESL